MHLQGSPMLRLLICYRDAAMRTSWSKHDLINDPALLVPSRYGRVPHFKRGRRDHRASDESLDPTRSPIAYPHQCRHDPRHGTLHQHGPSNDPI